MTMTDTAILHIPGQDKPLNKKQKEFNTLSETIEALDRQIADLQQAYDEMLRRMPSDLDPLIREYQGYRADIVNLWDRAYDAEHFRKAYQTKLAYLITENAYDLIKNHERNELKPVFNKYSPTNIDVLLEEERLRETSRIQDPAFLLESENVTEPEVLFHELSAEEQQRIKAERREQRMDQRTREAQQAKTTKSVRSVYMELVKTFHPDRETNEAEKLRKTETMQRITKAYQANNLLDLLKLQMELEQIDRAGLENLNKNQLSYYNKILRQQVDELDQQKVSIQQKISAVCGLPWQHAQSQVTVIAKFNTNINELKAEIKNIKKVSKHWLVPSQLKTYLKPFQIPNQPEEDDDE
ncbi:hypothetical protein SAMN04487996_103233 [Dyadobacter soli]|uniref:DnaJ domain-containing protein n=1 Tax=Dyadobacter soli TaxID=659014 RepID=A0A1G6ZTW6_9BACT|nr:hypothetical protein [Dyadobacter soli]SDE06108.1 hypothetical protein SAMN04487996_103233 [Dyadobacter soli]